jgi:hypothetical protein
MNTHLQNWETPSRARVDASSVPDWAGLMPVGIVALGTPSRPVERLIGTQAAVYQLIVWLGRLRMPWPSRRGSGAPAMPIDSGPLLSPACQARL